MDEDWGDNNFHSVLIKVYVVKGVFAHAPAEFNITVGLPVTSNNILSLMLLSFDHCSIPLCVSVYFIIILFVRLNLP